MISAPSFILAVVRKRSRPYKDQQDSRGTPSVPALQMTCCQCFCTAPQHRPNQTITLLWQDSLQWNKIQDTTSFSQELQKDMQLVFMENTGQIIPVGSSPRQDLVISEDNSLISPSVTAHNLGVTTDNQLSFSSHNASLSHSCRFLLFNIRRIRPYLSIQATPVLICHFMTRLLYVTHSWQLCLWAPFNLYNWSRMQLHDLFSPFPNSPTPPHRSASSTDACL